MSILFIPAIIFVIDVFLGAVHLSRDMSRGGGSEPIYLFILRIFEHFFLDRSLIYSCSQRFEHFLIQYQDMTKTFLIFFLNTAASEKISILVCTPF